MGSSLAFSLKEDPVRCAKVCDKSWVILIHLQPMELREVSEKLKSMEQLSLNNGNGQSYGYIVYRKRHIIYVRTVRY